MVLGLQLPQRTLCLGHSRRGTDPARSLRGQKCPVPPAAPRPTIPGSHGRPPAAALDPQRTAAAVAEPPSPGSHRPHRPPADGRPEQAAPPRRGRGRGLSLLPAAILTPPGSADGCRRTPRAQAIPVGRYRTAGTTPPHGSRGKRGGSGLAAEAGLATLPRARTADSKGAGAHRGKDKAGGSHLGPAGRARDGPAAARRGLKSPAPPAPPSVRGAHWSLPAPPALAPAPLIGPFESGSYSACSPRAPEPAAGPAGARTAAGGPSGAALAPLGSYRAVPVRALCRPRVPTEGAGGGCRALYGQCSAWREAQVQRQPGQTAGPACKGLKHLGADGFGFGKDPVTEQWASSLRSVSL